MVTAVLHATCCFAPPKSQPHKMKNSSVKLNELPWLQIPFKLLRAIYFSENGLHLFRRISTGLFKIEFRPYM